LLLSAAVLSVILSDPFRFVYKSGTESFNVAYSLVRVLAPDGNTLLEAHTDRYGRVRLDLGAGTYDAEITYGGRRHRVRVEIVESTTIRLIELR
jgi:hypothetical protein